MGRFATVQHGTTNGSKGAFAKVGDHVVRIDAFKVIPVRKKSDAVVVEYTYVASTNPLCGVGKSSSEFMSLDNESTDGNMLQFLLEAITVFMRQNNKLGADQVILKEQVTEPLIEWAVSPANPLRGLILGLSNFEVPTRAGGTFTKHLWCTKDAMIARLSEVSKLAAQIAPQLAGVPLMQPTVQAALPPAPPKAPPPPPPSQEQPAADPAKSAAMLAQLGIVAPQSAAPPSPPAQAAPPPPPAAAPPPPPGMPGMPPGL